MARGADPAFRCSASARDRGDSLSGTALPGSALLLVEDPGSWGSAPHPVGSLDADVVEHLHACTQALGARLLLIRRPGRSRRGQSRRWMLADVAAASLRVGTVADPRALIELRPAVDGTPDDTGVFLVCTQGRHDICCAELGRPVARALEALAPGRVWECSHVGGDRFAANVLGLPSGIAYGYVTPADAAQLVRAEASGTVVRGLLRGRMGLPPAAQVAEAALRERTGDDRTGAFSLVALQHHGSGWSVTMEHAAAGGARNRWVAYVEETHTVVPVGLTCAADGPGRLRRLALVDLVQAGG